MHEATITPMAMAWFARFPYRRCSRGPNAVFSAAPNRGKSGMSQSHEMWIAWATASPAAGRWTVASCAACAAAACPACSACCASAARSGKLISSLAQEVGLFHVDGAEGLVDGEHDRESHCGFRGREDDHEDAEDLPREPRRPFDEMIEGDEVHVGCVQDQLDAHQDPDGVPARDDGDHAEREEHRADDEEVGQPDRHHLRSEERRV